MFARTDRLLLRPGWVEDAPQLHAAIADEAVAYKLARLPWPYSLADAAAYLGRERGQGEADCLILLRTPGAPTLIGGVGIARRDGAPELGYWIAPHYWNQGYATEAATAVVAMARDSLKLDRLTSGHFEDNPASGRVLAKLGFAVTGVEPRHCLARGTNVPCVTLAKDLRERVAA
ncbi:N-acetyltransferase domain-containing protein [Sphingomonas antarctica]|uniref:GNAT family N-acetyltransferase n=1 Tax=Sphingomonas antarctica TaxID=2040274 RepID=UPI0039EB0C99